MLDSSSEVGLADVGFAEPGALGPADVIVQMTTVDGTLLGVSLDDIISLKISDGFHQPVSTADVVLRNKPAVGDYMDPVTLTVNGIICFDNGVMADEWDFTGWPTSVTLHAKHELCKAEKFINQVGDLDAAEGQPGMTLDVLLGGPESGTLKQITTAVLAICGVGYNPDNFADPPHIYGLEAPEELTWRLGESGLAFLQRIFEASAGYRLFGASGQLYLAQIIGRPRDDAPDFTLVYGTHILEGARANRNKSKARNGVTIKGYDDGAGDGPLQVDVVEANYDWSPDVALVEVIPSSLIEDETFATELATDYWLPEVNREIWTASIPTWIDVVDVVMGPAQTALLDATDELDVGEPGWVLGVELTVSENGELVRTVQLAGGGLPADYDPLPV